jgi:hypothetical protein
MTTSLKGARLPVALGASQVRRRLKGHGFGVRRVVTDGKNRAVINHTATGEHLRQLEALVSGRERGERQMKWRFHLRTSSVNEPIPAQARSNLRTTKHHGFS